jgi:hypothetical protein
MRFRLRTLLIVLALGPPVLAGLIVIVWIAVSSVRLYLALHPTPVLPPAQ